MIVIKQLYIITSYMPDCLFNEIVKSIMSAKVGLIHFLAYLFVLIFQIPFLVINIQLFKKQRKKSEIKAPLVIEKEKDIESIISNHSSVTSDTPNDTPQPSDNRTPNTPY